MARRNVAKASGNAALESSASKLENSAAWQRWRRRLPVWRSWLKALAAESWRNKLKLKTSRGGVKSVMAYGKRRHRRSSGGSAAAAAWRQAAGPSLQ